MSSLAERLAYLITADGGDAIRTFERVGDSADRDLGKADNRLDKLGGRLTTAGAGMLAFAGVAGGALASFASASEEANQSQIRLDASMAANPSLANESSARFTELASAIQKKTAADGDAIVAGEAVLAQFGLTGDQLEELTPLLVDYAQKTGKDIPTAAADLGKALDGKGRALKAIGIDFEDTGTRAGNFNEIVGGLRTQVGGFAEREGATFSGRLQSLKNQLGDVQEGMGVGVVQAAQSMLGPLTAVSDKFTEMSPEAQAFTGKLLAIGTAGVGAIGGLSLVAGQLIKLRDRFTETDAAGARTLTTMGKIGASVGVVTTLVAVGLALKEVVDQSDELTANVEELSRMTDRELVQSFDAAYEAVKKYHGEQKAASEQLDAFRQVAEGNVGTAKRLRDALAEQGRDVSELDRILREEAKAQQQATADSRAGTEALGDQEEATEDATEATDDLVASMKDLLDITNDVFDANIDYSESVNATEDAIGALNDVMSEKWETDDQVRIGTEALERATLDAEKAVLAQSRAAADLAVKQSGLTDETDIAALSTRTQKAELEKIRDTLAPGSPLRKRLDEYIYSLASIPKTVTTSVETNYVSRGEPGSGPPVVRRAFGGAVQAGQWAMVGEQGPEVVQFGDAGTVVPTDGTPSGAAGGGAVIPMPDPEEWGRRAARAMAREMQQLVRSA